MTRSMAVISEKLKERYGWVTQEMFTEKLGSIHTRMKKARG
jgi:hypothetical protein